jgi:hypothetical protein
MFIILLQRLFLEAILDIFYFPLWWYTVGFLHIIHKLAGYLKSGNEYLAPGLWLKNIFVPMFGQYDIQGKIISFFMRLVQVIARTIALAVWIVVILCLGFAWLAWPVVVVFFLVRSLIA